MVFVNWMQIHFHPKWCSNDAHANGILQNENKNTWIYVECSALKISINLDKLNEK